MPHVTSQCCAKSTTLHPNRAAHTSPGLSQKIPPPAPTEPHVTSQGCAKNTTLRPPTVPHIPAQGSAKKYHPPAPTGQHTSPGCNPGYDPIESVRSEGTPHKRQCGRGLSGYAAFLQNAKLWEPLSPGLHPGLVCSAPLGLFKCNPEDIHQSLSSQRPRTGLNSALVNNLVGGI